MRRGFGRNNRGMKQNVVVILDGVIIDRQFRNKGEAVGFLQREEDLSKDEIKRRVKFEMSNPDEEDNEW